MTGIIGYAIHQIVHLVFDIRTKYKHERTININETCPWNPGGGGGGYYRGRRVRDLMQSVPITTYGGFLRYSGFLFQ